MKAGKSQMEWSNQRVMDPGDSAVEYAVQCLACLAQSHEQGELVLGFVAQMLSSGAESMIAAACNAVLSIKDELRSPLDVFSYRLIRVITFVEWHCPARARVSRPRSPHPYGHLDCAYGGRPRTATGSSSRIVKRCTRNRVDG